MEVIDRKHVFTSVAVFLFFILPTAGATPANVTITAGETIEFGSPAHRLQFIEAVTFNETERIKAWQNTVGFDEYNITFNSTPAQNLNATLWTYNRDTSYTTGEDVLTIGLNATAGSTAEFGFTGFPTLSSQEYVLYVDGIETEHLGTDGDLSWSYDSWSRHNFTVTVSDTTTEEEPDTDDDPDDGGSTITLPDDTENETETNETGTAETNAPNTTDTDQNVSTNETNIGDTERPQLRATMGRFSASTNESGTWINYTVRTGNSQEGATIDYTLTTLIHHANGTTFYRSTTDQTPAVTHIPVTVNQRLPPGTYFLNVQVEQDEQTRTFSRPFTVNPQSQNGGNPFLTVILLISTLIILLSIGLGLLYYSRRLLPEFALQWLPPSLLKARFERIESSLGQLGTRRERLRERMDSGGIPAEDYEEEQRELERRADNYLQRLNTLEKLMGQEDEPSPSHSDYEDA